MIRYIIITVLIFVVFLLLGENYNLKVQTNDLKSLIEVAQKAGCYDTLGKELYIELR